MITYVNLPIHVHRIGPERKRLIKQTMLGLARRTDETVEGELGDFFVGRMFVILNRCLLFFFSSPKQNG
jgi:hypothetical protein